jgi:hypothetical protein
MASSSRPLFGQPLLPPGNSPGPEARPKPLASPWARPLPCRRGRTAAPRGACWRVGPILLIAAALLVAALLPRGHAAGSSCLVNWPFSCPICTGEYLGKSLAWRSHQSGSMHSRPLASCRAPPQYSKSAGALVLSQLIAGRAA